MLILVWYIETCDFLYTLLLTVVYIFFYYRKVEKSIYGYFYMQHKKSFFKQCCLFTAKKQALKNIRSQKNTVNKSIIEYIKQILVTEMLCELSQSKSVYKSINTNKSNTSLNIGYN